MHLLDVAPIGGGHYHHHHIRQVIEKPKEVIDTLQNSTVCPDSTANDSISQSVVNGISGSSDDASMMMWSIVVVLFALALCLLFIINYRRAHPSLS
jgi:hypothetical protein